MKRIGIQWDLQRKDGRDYVHVGLYVDSPDKKRTAARVAAFVTVLAFIVAVTLLTPDPVHTPTVDVITGQIVR
jgi:hypothetical protein